ncbi:ABC transporter ATP-binding protein [Actinopolymorpha pittospori]|uniref:ATP-binding cassette subfamily B protein n=1 Tax=Actinopolymorpha pittospori TaxID=648752 RepID=A0A927MU84_9ACTN|nr:ABC transporter ATP-binding protein [Actinopolymorpha pittospori]MBE1603415.1 ATP-binding cassette subfamily B protein [Actinopolymorpha pittospori]
MDESIDAPDNDRHVSFWQLAAPVRTQLVWSGVLMAAGAASGLLPVAAAMALIQTLVPAAGGDPGATGQAWLLVAALVASLLVSQALSTAGYIASHFADATLGEAVRQRQITHLLRLPLVWFSRNASGRIKKTVQDDLHKVHYLIAHAIPDFVNGTVRPASALVFLFVVDWRLGLVSLLPLALSAATLPFFLRDVTAQYARYNAGLAALSAAVVEFVRGIAPIKVFEVEGRGPRRFVERAAWHHRFYQEWSEATIRGGALLHVFTSPVFAVLVAAAGASLLIVGGGLSPLALVPAVLLSGNIAGPLSLLIQMRQFMREANGAARSIHTFFALPAAAEPEAGRTPDGHRVAIEQVDFAYADSGPLALDGVTTHLEPGTVTALVGPSGSGKSTFAALLPRLIDPDHGTVALGDADTRRLSAEELYAVVGFVFQQPYLLRMSIRDNIAMAKPGAGDAEVIAAATTAQIHERIMQLPDGYDTIVGEGARLSGGERQRLSIARAVLMDTPLLVLDEATAFADPDSEAAIQQALAALTHGRTLLVIAHRLHTVAHADRILVLDRGRITEAGTHDQLIAAGGVYARMWEAYQAARTLAPRAAEERSEA